MGIAERVRTLERRIRPAGLGQLWREAFQAYGLRAGLSPAEVEALVEWGARTGRHPGDALTEALTEHATRRTERGAP